MESIFLNGKAVGRVDGAVYYTKRNAQKHFFVKRQGYPISLDVLSALKSRGVRRVIILETRKDGSEHVYSCALDCFDRIEAFREHGYEAQKCLPLRRMMVRHL